MSKWKYQKPFKKKLLVNEFEIRPTNISEYDKLKQFHYIATKKPTTITHTFGLYHDSILYGIIIYNYPMLQLLARKKTIIHKITKNMTKSENAIFLNKNTRIISRIIIHPSVRGVGLASKLIEETWRLIDVRFIELVGFMSYYQNFNPDSYSYYIKVKRILKSSEFFGTSHKRSMAKRLKTPIMRYGYVLYINEKIKC